MDILWTVSKRDCELPWFSLEVLFFFVFNTALSTLLLFKKICVQNKGKDVMPVIDTPALTSLLKVSLHYS